MQQKVKYKTSLNHLSTDSLHLHSLINTPFICPFHSLSGLVTVYTALCQTLYIYSPEIFSSCLLSIIQIQNACLRVHSSPAQRIYFSHRQPSHHHHSTSHLLTIIWFLFLKKLCVHLNRSPLVFVTKWIIKYHQVKFCSLHTYFNTGAKSKHVKDRKCVFQDRPKGFIPE